MQKDKTPTKAMHHSSGGRRIPVSAAERAAAKPAAARGSRERGEVIRTRADAEADADAKRR